MKLIILNTKIIFASDNDISIDPQGWKADINVFPSNQGFDCVECDKPADWDTSIYSWVSGALNRVGDKPVPKEDYNAPILKQISDIEQTVTQRRIREATLGTDNGWLKSVNDSIAALRGTLK